MNGTVEGRDIPTPRSGGERITLNTAIGNSIQHGGVREPLTLGEWLNKDNRVPQYRARQLILMLLEQERAENASLRSQLVASREALEVLQGSFAKLSANSIMQVGEMHDVLRSIADMRLVLKDPEEVGGDVAGYYKSICELMRSAAKRVVDKDAALTIGVP